MYVTKIAIPPLKIPYVNRIINSVDEMICYIYYMHDAPKFALFFKQTYQPLKQYIILNNSKLFVVNKMHIAILFNFIKK